ncbi:MAG: DUF397 domain-containing protein [Streptosporangiales bacterium]
MTIPDRSDSWRKSSYSQQQTACVELPHTLDAVRDSKNGDVLQLNGRAVIGLLVAAKRR